MTGQDSNEARILEEKPVEIVEAELAVDAMTAKIVRYIIPNPTAAVLHDTARYQINMCLTPRPLNARACYPQHWGPHRFERLGDIFLLPPHEDLLIKGESGRNAALLCVIPPKTIHDVIGEEINWSESRLASTLDITSARIRALLFRITEEVRHPGLFCDKMLGFLSGELVIELSRFSVEVSERPITGGLAGWRLRLIDERLSDDPMTPSLMELAQLCNMSVRQLTRGFKVSRGCSIGDYVEQRRMETAKRLLVDGESVKTVAFTMGFSSPSSFTYAFRRAVGTSPSNFRQRQTRGIRED